MDIIKRAGTFAILFFYFIFSLAETKVPLEVQRLRAKKQSPAVKTKPLPKFNPVIQQEPFEAMGLSNSQKKFAASTASLSPRNNGAYEKLGTPAPAPVFVIYPGSLKKNVTRLANEFGWKHVVWNAKYDYQWIGTTRITANSLNEILNRILKRYPLQAVFYQGNHILAIEPRNFA